MIYANGKIYKITSDQTDSVYIGSTCSPLSQRMAQHRSHMRAHAAGKMHAITSSAIVQYDDAVITLIEGCPCESKEELIRRERFHIEATPNCVNRCIPGRTKAEYRADNREQILLKKAEHYQFNREQLLARAVEYHRANHARISAKKTEKITCDCGAEITVGGKSQHLRSAKHMRFVAAAEPEWADLLD